MMQIIWHDDAMPSINMDAKIFENTLASWFALAVRNRRRALKLTASELSRRTDELGYKISRGAIAKIEAEVRSGKIDVAEVLVLSAALDIPPALMLFPNFSTDGTHRVLPNVTVRSEDAVRWVAGTISFPQQVGPGDSLEGEPNPPNDGVNLIAAVSLREKLLETRIALVEYLHKVRNVDDEAKKAQHMLDQNNEQIAAAQNRIDEAREALWGLRNDPDDQGEPEDGTGV